jgi:hypothetical protein
MVRTDAMVAAPYDQSIPAVMRFVDLTILRRSIDAVGIASQFTKSMRPQKKKGAEIGAL